MRWQNKERPFAPSNVIRSLPPTEQYATAQQLAQLLKGQQLTHVLLASGQSAKSFAMLAATGLSGRAPADAIEYESGQLAVLAEYLRHVAIVSIGPQTSKACREFMGRVDIEAKIHTIDGLIAALIAAEI